MIFLFFRTKLFILLKSLIFFLILPNPFIEFFFAERGGRAGFLCRGAVNPPGFMLYYRVHCVLHIIAKGALPSCPERSTARPPPRSALPGSYSRWPPSY